MRPAPRPLPHAGARGSRWAIVLAGGQGIRLRSLTRHVHGDDRPKQFAVLSDDRSLLRQTLDRVALLIPPERTVVVTMAEHLRYVAAELDVSGHGPWVLPQPEDRGTAAALLWPAHWIQVRDPEATLAVFPSDHFVLEEREFMGHVEALASFVESKSDYTVLLGAQPTEPETDYGWIEPGERIGWARRDPVYRVRSLSGKAFGGGSPLALCRRRALEHSRLCRPRRDTHRGRPGLRAGARESPGPGGVLRGHRPRALGAPAGVCPGAGRELLTLDARSLAAAPRSLRLAGDHLVRSRHPDPGAEDAGRSQSDPGMGGDPAVARHACREVTREPRRNLSARLHGRRGVRRAPSTFRADAPSSASKRPGALSHPEAPRVIEANSTGASTLNFTTEDPR